MRPQSAVLSRASFLATLGSIALAPLPACAQTTPTPPIVELGDDIFIRESWRELDGRTVGIVTNQSGVLSSGEAFVDALRRNPAVNIQALFGPEHGIRGTATAGSVVASGIDAKTGLPVHSLYGATRRPTREMLDGIDVLLFDIQDVGTRTYTYISTMAYVMQSAREFGKSVWVLDRPNPIGANVVEGPVLDPAFSSFIGLYPIAMRHGMTIGELARLFNDRFAIGCDLRVFPMRNYRRAMLWADTGLRWIPTSPNIPTWQTALVYPATGLLSEAGIHNGAGKVIPFEPFFFAGAYGLNGTSLAAELNARRLPGLTFHPASWTPQNGFWEGKTLTGVELRLSDPRAMRSVRTAVEILTAVRTVAPRFLHLNAEHLDRDWGTDALRIGLTANDNAAAIEAGWNDGTAAFQTLRKQFLIYT